MPLPGQDTEDAAKDSQVEGVMEKIRKLPGNEVCADCNAAGKAMLDRPLH